MTMNNSKPKRIVRAGVLVILLMAVFPSWYSNAGGRGARSTGYHLIFYSGGDRLDLPRLLVQWVLVVCLVVWGLLATSSANEPYQPSLPAVWAAKLRHWLASLYQEEPFEYWDWKTVRVGYILKRLVGILLIPLMLLAVGMIAMLISSIFRGSR